MKNILYICLILICTTLSAQNAEKEIVNNRYQNYTSYSLLIGSQHDYNTYIHAIQMDHNYLMTKNLAFGLSTGIEFMDINMSTLGPNIKLLLPGKNKSSIFASFSYGAVIPLEKAENNLYDTSETNGKRFFNTEVGYTFPSKKHLSFFIAMGYRYQAYSYTREDWWLNTVERKITYNRFLMKAGIKL